jgi:hypothetical protein
MTNLTNYHTILHRNIYQYFFLLMQIAVLSGAIVMLFEAFWSATIFLPLSVAAELLVKFIITHAIERFVHHR